MLRNFTKWNTKKVLTLRKGKKSSLLVEKKPVLFFLLNLKVSLIHSFTHLCTKCIENCGENCCMLTRFLLLWLCNCAASPIPFSLAFRYHHMTELQGIGHGQKWQSPLPDLEYQNPPHTIFFLLLFSTLGPTREESADLRESRSLKFYGKCALKNHVEGRSLPQHLCELEFNAYLALNKKVSLIHWFIVWVLPYSHTMI